jgi:hypothetical protein
MEARSQRLAGGEFCRERPSVAWSDFGDRKPKSLTGRDLATLRVATKLLAGRQKCDADDLAPAR